VPEPTQRAIWVCDPSGPALVIGSAQPLEQVDRRACAEVGIPVVRRRSGGGAVLLVPGEILWVDLLIPPDDPLWQDDVGLASHWVGDAWASALGALGIDAQVHRGGLVRSPWSRQVCFAGLGPGEVSLAGRKVVGIAQRRTRRWARFQCVALGRWHPTELLRLLALEPAERKQAEVDLAAVAIGVEVELDALLAALLRHLPGG
jgi:lipoate-protein ligase A